jgi:hypothetical protein
MPKTLTACSMQTAYRGTICGHHIWPIEADDQHSQLFLLAQTSYTAQSLAHLQFSRMHLTTKHSSRRQRGATGIKPNEHTPGVSAFTSGQTVLVRLHGIQCLGETVMAETCGCGALVHLLCCASNV